MNIKGFAMAALILVYLYRLTLGEKAQTVVQLCEAADELTVGLKEFLILPEEEKGAYGPACPV